MYPSRPSSTNSNPSYRATTPTLIDFFANEREEQRVRADAHPQPTPLAELGPRRTTPDTVARVMENVGPAVAPRVTIVTIERYLLERGFLASSFLKDETIMRRLNAANISAETLLTAFKAAFDADHRLLATLGVHPHERYQLITRLGGIVTSNGGFKTGIKTAIQDSNNDPEQLIANVLHYMRDLGY